MDAPHFESYDDSHDHCNEETDETILSEPVYDETIFDDWDDDIDCSTQDASIEPGINIIVIVFVIHHSVTEEVLECSDHAATMETTRLCE